MNKDPSIQWHDMSELMQEKPMRYTPPETKRRAAYDDGQRSMTPYIVGSALVGLLVGFFVGRVIT